MQRVARAGILTGIWTYDICDIYTTCQLNASRFTSVFVGSILSISSGNSHFFGGFLRLHQPAISTKLLEPHDISRPHVAPKFSCIAVGALRVRAVKDDLKLYLEIHGRIS